MLGFAANLRVGCYWYDRPLTGGDFLDRTKSFLARILFEFPELSTVRNARNFDQSQGFIENDFSNFDQEIVSTFPDDWVYINHGTPNRNFTRECRAAICFRADINLGRTRTAVDLFIQCAIGRTNGRASDHIIIDISPGSADVDFLRKLLKLCIEVWNPHHAIATRSEIDHMLKQPIGNVHVGWLTYLADNRLRAYLPDGVHSENCNGGVLIYASECPVTVADEKGIDRLVKIIDALGAQGILNHPRRLLAQRASA